MIDIGSKISKLRKSHNMTQQELADKLHISNKVVSKWELGTSEPDLNTLANIAEIFNISIGELLGDATPAPETAKGDLNTRGYNFFRRNYMTIIQLVLIWAATIVAMIGFGYLAGYDLVTSILPDHLIWGSIGLTIGMALIQVFLTLIRPGHISITILKSVLILVLFALALSCYFYLGYTGEHAQEFFIVAAISYTIFFIVSILHLLLDLKIINAPAPFKLGKILFILVIVFTSLQCGVVLGQIANTAVGFYDLRTPEYITITNQYISFKKIGETATLKTEYPEFTRHDPFTFKSQNPEIATVDENGVVTATGYGRTFIQTIINDEPRDYCEIYVEKPSFNVTEDGWPVFGDIDVYAGNSTTFSVYAGDQFDTLGDFKSNFKLECSKPFTLVSESFMDNKYTVTVQFDSEYGATSYDADFYITSLLSDQSWQIVTVSVNDINEITANNITTRAGMYFDVNFTVYPSKFQNQNFEIKYDPEYIFEDNGRYVAQKEGSTNITITAINGVSTTITVTIEGLSKVNIANNTYRFYALPYADNTDYVKFTFENNAYHVPITAVVESEVDNLVTFAYDSTNGNTDTYRVQLNALGTGTISFFSPFGQVGKVYPVTGGYNYSFAESLRLVKTYNKMIDLTYSVQIPNDVLTVEIADKSIAKFQNDAENIKFTIKPFQTNNLEFWVVGLKIGETEITVTSQKTGEQLVGTLNVLGISELTCDATEEERTVAAGETKVIRFYFETNRLSESIHIPAPPTTLYNELTISVSTPGIIVANKLETIYDETDDCNYGQLEIIAGEIEGERAEVVVTISSPEGVKVEIPIIITNTPSQTTE